jgi:hypothetical protein
MLDSALCFSNFNKKGHEIAKVNGSELINNVTFPRIRQAVRNPVFVVFVFFFCLLICLFVCLLCLFSVYCLPNVVSVSGLSIFEFPSFYSNISLVWICYVVSLQDRLILLWVFYNNFLYISTNLPKSVCFTFYWNLVWCKWWLYCIYADSPTWNCYRETSLLHYYDSELEKILLLPPLVSQS